MKITKATKDKIAGKILLAITILSGALLVIIAGVMLYKGQLFFSSESIFKTIFGSTWNFEENLYGLKPYLTGSLMVTGVALSFGALPSVLCAIYLSEYTSGRLRKVLKPFVDLLAGVPSVIYGLWGLFYIVPFVREYLAPWLGASSPGQSLISAGFVLGIMITPIIISVTDEVLQSIPDRFRDASLALGSTRWQAVKTNVRNVALPGIIGAVILGFGRAIGETIAMSMISGSVGEVPGSIFDPFATLTSLINNKIGYTAADPKSVSALAMAGFILLIIVLIANIAGRIIVEKTTKRIDIQK